MNKALIGLLALTISIFISSCVKLQNAPYTVDYEELYNEMADQGDVYSKWLINERKLIGKAITHKEYQKVWSSLKNHENIEAFLAVLDVAEKGFYLAQNLITYLYETGESVLTRVDDRLWLETASSQGSDLAIYELIMLDNQGDYFAKSEQIEKYMPHDKAFFARWFAKAEKDADRIRFGFAMGQMYEQGLVVPRNYKKASNWYDFTFDYALKRINQLGKKDFNLEEEIYWIYELYDGSKDGEKHIARWLLEKGSKDGKFKYDLAEALYLGLGIPTDREQAYRWYFESANEGYAEAMYIIGSAYDKGRYFASDINEAIKWYQKAANKGHKYSMIALANIITKNNFNEKNSLIQKAISLVSQEAKNKGILKEEAVGDLFSFANATDENLITAVKWYQDANDKGSRTAGYKIGRLYEKGRGVTKDYYEAVKWYQTSADRDYNPAKIALAGIYMEGLGGIEPNFEITAKLLHDAVSGGSSQALVLLGKLYLEGKYVLPNPLWAESWLVEASKKGEMEADVILGINYFTGKGLIKDSVKAEYWLNAVEFRAENEALDILNQAVLLETSNLNLAKKGRLFKLLSLAIDENNSKAQLLLAKLFDYGINSNFNNPEMSRDWYEKAGWNGEKEAFFILGYKYFEGFYGVKDYEKASRYFAESARRGHSEAKSYLAWFLLNGYGIKKDVSRAYALYKQAEEERNTMAKHHLGLIYEKGLTGEVNIKQAIIYYLEASKDGHMIARKDFCRLFGKEWVDSADRFAEIWCKGN